MTLPPSPNTARRKLPELRTKVVSRNAESARSSRPSSCQRVDRVDERDQDGEADSIGIESFDLERVSARAALADRLLEEEVRRSRIRLTAA